MKKTLILILILFTFKVYSQTLNYVKSIGDFQEATSFYINPTGFIFVTDARANEVYKIDTLGNIINDIGGYGWKAANFDYPSDVFATSLNIYVCDKNNHRVQRFDKDLNFISSLYTRENDNSSEQFGYPLAAETSNQGDLYILDSENSRIVKFDLFGNFVLNFGGYNDVNYSLKKPKKLAISSANNIFVLDSQNLVVFDQYGNEISAAKVEKDYKYIRIINDILVMNTDNEILTKNLRLKENDFTKLTLNGYDFDRDIICSLIFNKKLYVLTEKNIVIFQ